MTGSPFPPNLQQELNGEKKKYKLNCTYRSILEYVFLHMHNQREMTEDVTEQGVLQILNIVTFDDEKPTEAAFLTIWFS